MPDKRPISLPSNDETAPDNVTKAFFMDLGKPANSNLNWQDHASKTVSSDEIDDPWDNMPV